MSSTVRGKQKVTNAEAVLRGLAHMKPDVVEPLINAQIENLENSGLDPKTYALTKIAALTAIGSRSMASWAWQVNLAKESGVSEAEMVGTLIALAPTVGMAHIVSAAAELAFALGYQIEERMS